MRLKCKKRLNPGSTRIVRRFSLFPLFFWDEEEKREIASWLETVYIEQLYIQGYEGDCWFNNKIVTKKQYKKFKRHEKNL